MVGYLDSSAVLDYVLEGSIALDQVWEFERIFSSELVVIECRRGIFREKLSNRLNDETMLDALDRLTSVVARVDQMEITKAIKRRAGEAFPVQVKTLDALHLATALAVKNELDEEVVLFSHDRGMNRCAKLLGLIAPWYS